MMTLLPWNNGEGIREIAFNTPLAIKLLSMKYVLGSKSQLVAVFDQLMKEWPNREAQLKSTLCKHHLK